MSEWQSAKPPRRARETGRAYRPPPGALVTTYDTQKCLMGVWDLIGDVLRAAGGSKGLGVPFLRLSLLSDCPPPSCNIFNTRDETRLA